MNTISIYELKKISSPIIIDIRDNGKGFDVAEIPANKHFGLSLMQERVELLKGRMTLSSTINKGTKIHVEIPLN